ncbi:MAG: hypothetical protein HYY78_17170 [Betaproteobacteria bacterium]|nr:hypothetical protein [Betaproteobacteria bacterium]
MINEMTGSAEKWPAARRFLPSTGPTAPNPRNPLVRPRRRATTPIRQIIQYVAEIADDFRRNTTTITFVATAVESH